MEIWQIENKIEKLEIEIEILVCKIDTINNNLIESIQEVVNSLIKTNKKLEKLTGEDQ